MNLFNEWIIVPSFLIPAYFLGGLLLGFVLRWIYGIYKINSIEKRAVQLKQKSIEEIEEDKRNRLTKFQTELDEKRRASLFEIKKRQNDASRMERKLSIKEKTLDKKNEQLGKKLEDLDKFKDELLFKETDLLKKEDSLLLRIEDIAKMSLAEAEDFLFKKVETNVLNKVNERALIAERELKEELDKKARQLLVESMQRIAPEVTNEVSIESISLPNESMKGRIIGKEGRNVRALELLTGVDIVIDDTPESIIVSCFDPIRRAVAKDVLSELIKDGRIHPARIEMLVQKVAQEVYKKAYESAEQIVLDLGIRGMQIDLIKALGKLHYRSSFGQNVLLHSKEVALLGSMIAKEIGANAETAKRACLLHDIGKGIESDGDKNHAELGAELAQHWKEDAIIVNAIASHHNDIEPQSVEAIIVQIADAISASRLGARRGSFENYIKKLEKIEEIVQSFEGIENVYAVQAGREVRVLVQNTLIDDQKAKILARKIADKIELEMHYIGRIKITLIRESRFIEYAR